ncbi:hypothetical protein LOTGIDRAFT_169908 [Lottia gigantea]|uniref:Uncharacterized protein n=1 Tax=Lottia gigantea TaxID=225164 RepID=V3ZER4_LOTGI|nr:hypothetical protein LOTGIDRAFT_169908 [Lottia gigantea]ESO82587.1 hypothetical protein LOTGIDRAFT_169908 [Lottia gigantea]
MSRGLRGRDFPNQVRPSTFQSQKKWRKIDVQLETLAHQEYSGHDGRLTSSLVRRKRKKKNQHDQRGNNSSPNGVIIEDNGIYDSAEQRFNRPIQMEIIENDLYVSSDDVMNFNSSDDGNTDQIPEVVYAVVNKGFKSDKPSKEASVDSGFSMSSKEPNSGHDRKFFLGPQGDEYTLIHKT